MQPNMQQLLIRPRNTLMIWSLTMSSVIHLVGQGPYPEVSSTDTLRLENLTITSTRASLKDPVSFHNISKTDIDKIYHGQDPVILLEQLTPSITTYSDGGAPIGNYAQFRMRGIAQQRINISLNGIPLNDMVDQGVYFSNFSDFGNSIESIQVQRGVGASNIGVASYGGAVNFQSSNIFQSDPHSEIQLTTGSFSTLRASAEISSGLMSNNTAMYARYSRTTTGGFKDHSASDAHSFFLSGGYLHDRGLFKLTAFAGKTQNDQSYLPVLGDDILINPRINNNHPNDTDDFEQEMIQLQYSHQHHAHLTSNHTLYYSGARGVFPFGIDDTTQYLYALSNSGFGISSNLNYTTSQWNIKSGLHAYTFERVNEEALAPAINNPYLRELTHKKEISTFIKTSYSLNKWLFYGDVSLRHTAINFDPDPILMTGIDHDRDWVFFNWVGGINYSLSPIQTIYASYGRAGREPTRSDMLFGTPSDILTNKVREEYVSDLEIGWRLTNKNLSLGANLFFMSFDNEISKIGALQQRSYIEVTQNVDKSARNGLELQALYQASDITTLSMNATYMTTKVDEYDNGMDIFENVEHLFSPKWLINASILHDFSKQLRAQLSGKYSSLSYMELSNNPAFTLPAYYVMDVQLDYNISSQLTLQLMVNNITDRLYYTDGSPVDADFDGIVEGPGYRIQPKRNFYFNLILQF